MSRISVDEARELWLEAPDEELRRLAGEVRVARVSRDGGIESTPHLFGGFAEVSPTGMTVLAEVAVPLGEADRMAVTVRIRELEESRDKLPNDATLDRTNEKIENFKALERHLEGAVAH